MHHSTHINTFHSIITLEHGTGWQATWLTVILPVWLPVYLLCLSEPVCLFFTVWIRVCLPTYLSVHLLSCLSVHLLSCCLCYPLSFPTGLTCLSASATESITVSYTTVSPLITHIYSEFVARTGIRKAVTKIIKAVLIRASLGKSTLTKTPTYLLSKILKNFLSLHFLVSIDFYMKLSEFVRLPPRSWNHCNFKSTLLGAQGNAYIRTSLHSVWWDWTWVWV